MLDKHPKLQTLVAVLLAIPAAWLLAVAVLLALALYTGTVHAADAAPRTGDVRCVPHKTFFGFSWGWDCHVPGKVAILTVDQSPAVVWCDDTDTECKSAGTARLKINNDALSGLTTAQQFDIAMRCTTTPGSVWADCQIAAKGEAK